METLNNNQKAFLELVKAGLWKKDVQLLQFGEVDYTEVLRLAEEQSVVGLVADGFNHVQDVKVPQEDVLQFVGRALQIEQRNLAMNDFVAKLIEKLRDNGIYTLLVKGQGIAQCYERPLWRACGDVDLMLSCENYIKAKSFLASYASKVDKEFSSTIHFSLTIENWIVELHGSLRGGLWKRLDRTLDEIRDAVFRGGNVRSWMNGKVQVFLPRADEDIVFVFSHILQHFFKGGIGLRQICDWCRLLYTYKDSLNYGLLESRIRKAGIMTEWKTFAALAVKYVGMPADTMPLYHNNIKWRRKADRVLEFILETGNFGHNRDTSYRRENSSIKRKTQTFWHITSDSVKHFFIFPIDSIKVWWSLMRGGLLTLVGK